MLAEAWVCGWWVLLVHSNKALSVVLEKALSQDWVAQFPLEFSACMTGWYVSAVADVLVW